MKYFADPEGLLIKNLASVFNPYFYTTVFVFTLKDRNRALVVRVRFSSGNGTWLVISKTMLFHPFSESYCVREMPNCILFGYH